MLRTISRQLKKAAKAFHKTSPWLKIIIILTLVMVATAAVNRHTSQKEGFLPGDLLSMEGEKFISKDGLGVYDQFYASLYDDLLFDRVKNEYEVGEIINRTTPDERSLVLDIGAGTGQHVALFNEKGIEVMGIDISPDMVRVAEKNYPGLDFREGDAQQVSLFPGDSFTHITCMYFTLYYLPDKLKFFQNAFFWLRPGGYLIIHLVNRDEFDPILNVADPLNMVSAQKYAKKRITDSAVQFKGFKYKANFSLDKQSDQAYFDETFKDDKNDQVRKHSHTLYMPSQRDILNIAKSVGFVLQAKLDLVPVQYEYQYLYILYKPD